MRISVPKRTAGAAILAACSRAAVGIAHRGVELCKPAVLEVGRPLRGDGLVEVLPHAGKRLLPLLGLLAQPFAVLAGQRLQQPLVEGIAIAGDARHQLRERDGGIVIARPRAADARSHQDRAREHRRGLE